ncbi:MAG: metal-sensing transcriptional repressor [Anaerolineae bacterium]
MTSITDERQKKTIHRLHRLQGQLIALERRVEEGATVEETVVQARAIEKGVASLIVYVVDSFVEQSRNTMVHDPEQAVRDIQRLIELIHQ